MSKRINPRGITNNPKTPEAAAAKAANQFKPGQSGNPAGAAKGKRISTWMLELGQMDKLPDPGTLPINGQIALARVRASLRDDESYANGATEIILDRTEGPLKQVVQLSGLNVHKEKSNDEIAAALLKRSTNE